MPTPSFYPTGAPIWIDLTSHDTAASTAFYEGLFGWTSSDGGSEFGGYVTFSLDDRRVAGMIGGASEGVPDSWTVYLQTDDAETTGQAVTGAGGLVFMGPQQVGPMGTMLLAQDADRAVVGAWNPAQMTGFQALAEPGAPAWFELHTTSFDDEVQFYQQAFGWTTVSMPGGPDFRYSQLTHEGEMYAGVMDASAYWTPGDPAAWLVYFNVADANAAAARAVELGGAIVDEPVDTPFGRMGTLRDTTGALLKIIA